MNTKLIITALLALCVGAVGGYEGAKASTPATAAPQAARGSFGGTRGGGNGGFIAGTVAAKDSGSVTLNTRDGSSRVVLVTPDTSVSKSVNGSLGDVTVGSEIIVTGTTNSDGSVSASLIQLRPTLSPQ